MGRKRRHPPDEYTHFEIRLADPGGVGYDARVPAPDAPHVRSGSDAAKGPVRGPKRFGKTTLTYLFEH